MKKFEGLYDVRDFMKDDANFILATFLQGIYYGDSWFSLIPKDIFMANYKKAAQALVLSSEIKVACLKEDHNVILGYSILSKDFQTIHYVHVKDRWRKQGIGTSLTPRRPAYVSHLTALGKRLLPKFPGAVFNPFAT